MRATTTFSLRWRDTARWMKPEPASRKECGYAVEQKKVVPSFVHGDPDSIAVAKRWIRTLPFCEVEGAH
jgi:hypothetical protein